MNGPDDELERQHEPPRPELNRPDPPQSKSRSSLLPVFMAGVVGLLGAAGLTFLMMPVAGVALAAGLVIFVLAGLAAFHYIVWGWWLGGVIREDVEAEERERTEENERRLAAGQPLLPEPEPEFSRLLAWLGHLLRWW